MLPGAPRARQPKKVLAGRETPADFADDFLLHEFDRPVCFKCRILEQLHRLRQLEGAFLYFASTKG